MPHSLTSIVLALLIIFTAGLAPTVGPAGAQGNALNVVATTTILADVAAHVGGEYINVQPLLPPDADTHAYQPTADDAARLARADLVLTVGMGYEQFLYGLVENAGVDVTVVVVSNGIEVLAYGLDHAHDEQAAEAGEGSEGEAAHDGEHLGVLGVDLDCAPGEHAPDDDADGEHAHGICDPHVWMDPANVAIWARSIADAFAAADPDHAADYQANADAYITQLEALHAELTALLDEVPEDRRVLLTNHEFMSYFAHAYDFEVAATVLPGGSTGAEVDPRSLAALIDLIEQQQVPAIFAEVSANSRLPELLAAETGLNSIRVLYSGSLSAADGPAATYLDFMRYNARTIVDALAG